MALWPYKLTATIIGITKNKTTYRQTDRQTATKKERQSHGTAYIRYICCFYTLFVSKRYILC